jgi:hypothetical protein
MLRFVRKERFLIPHVHALPARPGTQYVALLKAEVVT